MKHLLIIFSLLLTSISWSKNINLYDLVERDGLYYKKFTNTPFSGRVTGRFTGKIQDGKKNGEWLNYHKNGQLQSKLNYKDGNPEGKWFLYHDNGQLQIKKNYIDGKKNGEYLEYHDNGQLREKRNYKDGKLEGEHIIYNWRSDKLLQKINYKDGKAHGEIIEYYDNGQIKSKKNYKEGKREGEWFFYMENGKLSGRTIYKDDELIKIIDD